MIALLFKAEGLGLVDAPVTVAGHVRRGVFVAPYRATRKKAPAPVADLFGTPKSTPKPAPKPEPKLRPCDFAVPPDDPAKDPAAERIPRPKGHDDPDDPMTYVDPIVPMIRTLVRDAAVDAFTKWQRLIGRDPQQTIPPTQDWVESLCRKSQVWTNMSAVMLSQILETGWFENQSVTGTSIGGMSIKTRELLEEAFFGCPGRQAYQEGVKRPIPTPDHTWKSRLPLEVAQVRPKYGFLTDSPDGKMARDSPAYYGHTSVRFKPDVRTRTTFLCGDSFKYRLDVSEGDSAEEEGKGQFAKSARNEQAPSPVNAPQWYSMTGAGDAIKFIDTWKQEKCDSIQRHNHDCYIEAQIYGRLSIDDIAEVILRTPYGTAGTERDLYADQLALCRALKAHNIPYRMVPLI